MFCAKPTGQDVCRRFGVLILPTLALALCCDLGLLRRASADEGLGKHRLVSTDRGAVSRLSKLVAELGNETFAVREEATQQLIRAGIEAKPLLLAALSSDDAEVRFRAKRVLEIVVEGEFQRRLKAFAEDVDGSRGLTMPGWQAFKDLVGDSRSARAIFVEMQQAEAELLEAYDKDPKLATQALSDRAQILHLSTKGRLVNRWNRNVIFSSVAMQPSFGSSLSILLVGGDEDVPVKDDAADHVRTLLNNRELHTALQGSDDRSEMCRKILGRWVRRDFNDSVTLINLSMAMRYHLPEALESAIRVLGRDKTTTQLRQYALLTVGNYGSEEHLSAVKPLLKDPTIVYAKPVPRALPAQAQKVQNPAINNRIAAETQMRDVALVVTIKLSGQDPKQFGFDHMKLSDPKRLALENSQSRMGFITDEDRVAAFRKWEEWQKGEQQAAVKKPKADTIER